MLETRPRDELEEAEAHSCFWDNPGKNIVLGGPVLRHISEEELDQQ